MAPAVDTLPAAPAAKGPVAALLGAAAAPASGAATASAGAGATPTAEGTTTPGQTGAAAATTGGGVAGNIEDFLRVLESTLVASTAGAAAAAPAAATARVAPAAGATTDALAMTASAARPSGKPAGSASDATRKDATPEEVVQWLMQMLLPTAPSPLALQAPTGAGRVAAANAFPGRDGEAASPSDALKALEAQSGAVLDATPTHGKQPDPLLAVGADAAAMTAGQGHAANEPAGAPQAPVLDAAIGASLAQLHAATAPLQPSAPPTLVHELRSPLGSTAWVQELGGHLTLMAHQGSEHASLQVAPPDLGPIEVRIAVHDTQASVWFGAAHTETRAALESALPRLRELFAAQGLALSDAGVFREPPRREPPPVSAATRSGTETSESPLVTRVAAARVGLIDTYV